MSEENRRADWEDNHLEICKVYFKIIEKTGKRPSLKSLSKATGISVNSIHKHLSEISELKFGERFKDLKLLSGKLLLKMYEHGSNGSSSCAKLFYQIAEGFSEKHEVKTIDKSPLRTMSKKELEEELNKHKIPNRVSTHKEPINDDEREAEAEND